MPRNCILLVIVAMAFTCCNAIDQVELSKTKIQNSVQTDHVPLNDRNSYRFLRGYKTEELDDATDNEERAMDVYSLKSLLRTKKTVNDFSKTKLEQMAIDSAFKKKMFALWSKGYSEDKIKSMLIKKDPAMLLDFMNGNSALRPLIT